MNYLCRCCFRNKSKSDHEGLPEGLYTLDGNTIQVLGDTLVFSNRYRSVTRLRTNSEEMMEEFENGGSLEYYNTEDGWYLKVYSCEPYLPMFQGTGWIFHKPSFARKNTIEL
jgi:hypothetical protein